MRARVLQLGGSQNKSAGLELGIVAGEQYLLKTAAGISSRSCGLPIANQGYRAHDENYYGLTTLSNPAYLIYYT